MASVVFFRAVNVGQHQRFLPSQLARELAEYEVVNVGAAGTFIVRAAVTPATLRQAILRRLPFAPELIICSQKEILAFEPDIFSRPEWAAKEARPFVSILQEKPASRPALPILQPPNDRWEVKVIAVYGRLAASLWWRRGKAIVYPNAVVEKHFAVPATTRNGNTFATIRRLLGS